MSQCDTHRTSSFGVPTAALHHYLRMNYAVPRWPRSLQLVMTSSREAGSLPAPGAPAWRRARITVVGGIKRSKQPCASCAPSSHGRRNSGRQWTDVDAHPILMRHFHEEQCQSTCHFLPEACAALNRCTAGVAERASVTNVTE